MSVLNELFPTGGRFYGGTGLFQPQGKRYGLLMVIPGRKLDVDTGGAGEIMNLVKSGRSFPPKPRPAVCLIAL